MHIEAKLYLVTLVNVILHSYEKVPFSKRSLSLSLSLYILSLLLPQLKTFFESLV